MERISKLAAEDSSDLCVLAAVLLATGYREPVCQGLGVIFDLQDSILDSPIKDEIDGIHAFFETFSKWVTRIPKWMIPPGLLRVVYQILKVTVTLAAIFDKIEGQLKEVEPLRPLYEANCGGKKDG